ncbi:MAG: hypothetical protein AAGI12_14980 [Pseudomonadota bacterium]
MFAHSAIIASQCAPTYAPTRTFVIHGAAQAGLLAGLPAARRFLSVHLTDHRSAPGL